MKNLSTVTAKKVAFNEIEFFFIGELNNIKKICIISDSLLSPSDKIRKLHLTISISVSAKLWLGSGTTAGFLEVTYDNVLCLKSSS